MSEITAVVQYADKTLAIFTPLRSLHLQPIQIKFTGDLDMEAWQAHLIKGRTKIWKKLIDTPGFELSNL